MKKAVSMLCTKQGGGGGGSVSAAVLKSNFNGGEWMWVMRMHAWVVCHWWDRRGGFHLSGIVNWW